MEIGAANPALAMQMQMISQMSSVTKDAQMNTQNQVAKLEAMGATNEQAIEESLIALSSGTKDGEIITEIYA